MRPNKLLTQLVILAGLTLLTTPSLAEDPDLNRLLASQCAQCHGTDGKAVGEMDSIAGKRFSDLYGDLREMQRDEEPGEIMHLQARDYNDNQLRRIAEYYSSLPRTDDD